MFIDVPAGAANSERAFALRPEVLEAWVGLNEAVKSNADFRRHELATLAAARALRSTYCCLAHGQVLAEQFFDPETVARLPEGLADADRAVMAFAEKVVVDATAITQADVDELRAHGLTDTDITNVVLAATIRCFFSKTLDALGAQPDALFADLPAVLRDASIVGRPIDTV
jgi:alkylhydroperoxidase family enzyme